MAIKINSQNEFDVAVIGAGHAGCEAAYAAARMGAKTILLTIVADNIAQLACSPSFGGPGRGQLIREIDALGGLMGRQIERNLLFKKTINTTKGTAVQAPWGIVDRRGYAISTKLLLEKTKNLFIFQSEVTAIQKMNSIFTLKTLFGYEIYSKTVVVAAGTFLNGKVFQGKHTEPGGRMGENPSTKLVLDLKKSGYMFNRAKTGSPPVVFMDPKKSIDMLAAETSKADFRDKPGSYEEADDLATFSSFKSSASKLRRLFKFTSSEKTRQIIQEHYSKGYLGKKRKTQGTRYCPSFEEKIFGHQETVGFSVLALPLDKLQREFYLHGLSMSIEPHVQQKVVASIHGLEGAEVIRPGYAVEYDHILPDQLNASLESRSTVGLFFAGQVNGTTGYEEAAAQGLMAGINAALKSQDKLTMILSREDAYIGVMIDDIVKKGVVEPYRMHSSRSEMRLQQRCENADLRLSGYGSALGLLTGKEANMVEEKRVAVISARLRKSKPNKMADKDSLEDASKDRLRSSSTIGGQLSRVREKEIQNEIIAEDVYSHMIRRENLKQKAVAAIWQEERIDPFLLLTVRGLSNEAKAMIEKYRPENIGELQKMPGLTLEDLSLIRSFIQKRNQ